MAYEGIEVEIKLKVDPDKATAVRDRLIQGGASEIHQVDAYFDSSNSSFLSVSPLREWLSIRNRGDRTIINHKFFHFGSDGKATHCDEVDVVVDDFDGAERLFQALGYKPLVTVDKRRVAGMLGDGFEVSVDDVAGLGWFIEIEATKSVGSVAETKQDLENFAQDGLGLTLALIDHKGYPHLLIEKLKEQSV